MLFVPLVDRVDLTVILQGVVNRIFRASWVSRVLVLYARFPRVGVVEERWEERRSNGYRNKLVRDDFKDGVHSDAHYPLSFPKVVGTSRLILQAKVM